jgi:hypothetical protein
MTGTTWSVRVNHAITPKGRERLNRQVKGPRTPEQAGMALLAIPYVPNRAEYLVLSNRRILTDQMAFLQKRFRRGSRLASAGTAARAHAKSR